MHTVHTVVIGAGHAGLAVSRLLTAAGTDHVVLDRGSVGESWRSRRWDSLHLLTPAWMTRLPGWSYDGPHPDGYLSAREFASHLQRYADSFGAPVQGGTTVRTVGFAGGGRRGSGRYVVATDRGTWRTENVVVATGPQGRANVPAGLSSAEVMTADRYRNPGQVPEGAVLVVGASASGVQIADELNRAGREVVLAVGRHTRMPRRYRGLDIYWWLVSTGRMARTIDTMTDVEAARREPSLQLVGRNDGDRSAPDLDLGLLQSRGVMLAGRLTRVTGSVAEFADDLGATTADADRRLHRFLDQADRFADAAGLTAEVWPATRPQPVTVGDAMTRLDLRRERIGAVVVAAGYREHRPWLRIPVAGPDGRLRQYRGATPAPGLYTVGQRFQHRRDSGLIDGARHDARLVVDHLLGHSPVRGVTGAVA